MVSRFLVRKFRKLLILSIKHYPNIFYLLSYGKLLKNTCKIAVEKSPSSVYSLQQRGILIATEKGRATPWSALSVKQGCLHWRLRMCRCSASIRRRREQILAIWKTILNAPKEPEIACLPRRCYLQAE